MQTKYIDYDVQDFLKDEFFVKWASGADPKLSDFWDKWIIEHPKKTETIVEAKQLIQTLRYSDKKTLDDDEYIKLYEGILKGDSHKGKPSKRSYIGFYRVAAAVSLIVISFLTFQNLGDNIDGDESAAQFQTKMTQNGEKLTLRLSDGTMVKMNAGSHLEYLEGFSGNVRVVKLTGEAFFEVARDETRPFIVRTEQMTVEALGTSFNVNSYGEDSNHIITLVTGKVGVSTLDKSTYKILVPGQQARVSEDTGIFVSEVDVAEATYWRDDILLFDESDFDTVIVSLERWYGVAFTIEGTVPALDTFSGKFKDENLINILDVMAFTSGFTYSINEKNVNIKF
ncbi:MAG: FecR domain-containing protein [Cyclobacteriaceae bacterium]